MRVCVCVCVCVCVVLLIGYPCAVHVTSKPFACLHHIRAGLTSTTKQITTQEEERKNKQIAYIRSQDDLNERLSAVNVTI